MAWFRYRTSSGEVYAESSSVFDKLPFGQAQVEDPTDNRTIPGDGWVFDGAELRDATQTEIDGFAAFTQTDDEGRTRLSAQETVDVLNSIQGQLLRAFALVVMDEINLLRQQFNTTTAESNQLTTTTLAPRTATQIKTAIKNKIQSGDAN